jgi:hypothetical protein
VAAAGRPQHRGVALDEPVPRVLVADPGAQDQSGDGWVVAHAAWTPFGLGASQRVAIDATSRLDRFSHLGHQEGASPSRLVEASRRDHERSSAGE